MSIYRVLFGGPLMLARPNQFENIQVIYLSIKALYTDKHDIIDKQYDIYKVHHIVHLFIALDCRIVK